MSEQTTSPIPPTRPFEIEPQALTFTQALQEVLAGKKVTKEDWASEEVYGFMANDQLMLHRHDKDHLWILSEGDIMGEDYFVLS